MPVEAGQDPPVEQPPNDLIAPYIPDGIDKDEADLLVEVLTKAQKDWDSAANKKIQAQAEQLKSLEAWAELGDIEQVRTAIVLHDSLVMDPVDTIRAIAGQFKEAHERDILEELMGSQAQPKETEEEAPAKTEIAPTFTMDQVKEMVQQMLEEQREAADEARSAQEAIETADRMVDDAITKAGFTPNPGMRELVVVWATRALEDADDQGVTLTSEEAIDKAIEAIYELGTKARKRNPLVPVGGARDMPAEYDTSTPEGRAAKAMDILSRFKE